MPENKGLGGLYGVGVYALWCRCICCLGVTVYAFGVGVYALGVDSC